MYIQPNTQADETHTDRNTFYLYIGSQDHSMSYQLDTDVFGNFAHSMSFDQGHSETHRCLHM